MSELLVNIDVPDLEAALVFYRDAFGLTLSRRLGAQAAELIGWPVRLYLLQQPAGSAAAATDRRRYDRRWTPVHFDLAVDDLDAGLADPFGHGFCLIEFAGRGYDELRRAP